MTEFQMAWGKQRQLIEAGQKAPDFRLERLGGGEVSLHEVVAGAPAVLAFFKVTCPVCQLTLPFLERIHAPGRLAICGISQNDAAHTRQFNAQFGLTFPTLLDSEHRGFETSNAYGISTVPTMFLIESDGSVSDVMVGWRKTDIERLGALAGVNPFRPADYVPEWKAG